MPLYLGKPGTALTSIRAPMPNVDRSPSAGEGVHELLAGGFAVDRRPAVARTWQMEWGWDDTVWWQLYGFYTGQLGYGPYCLYDPGAINLLRPNQASGTEPSRDTTGFSVDATEAVVSSTAQAYQGSRSLKWTLGSYITSGLLTLPAPAALTAWPTPAGVLWTFSVYGLSAGADASFDARLLLRWLDSSGATVSTTTGTYTAMSSSTWTRVTVTGGAPSGAVYVLPLVQVDGSDVAHPFDLFTRTATGWGTAPSGEIWTSGGGSASDYTTNGSSGLIAVSAVNSSRRETLVISTTDQVMVADYSIPAVASTSQIFVGNMHRYQDSSNYYQADLMFQTDSTVDLRLVSRIAASGTEIARLEGVGSYAINTPWTIRSEVVGTTLRAKAWPTAGTEPTDWHVTATTATITAAGAAGVRVNLDIGNTNTLPFTVTVDNVQMGVAAGADLYLDAMQLQLGPAATTWRPGEGPPLVSMSRLREVVGLAVPQHQQARTITCQFTQQRTAA